MELGDRVNLCDAKTFKIEHTVTLNKLFKTTQTCLSNNLAWHCVQSAIMITGPGLVAYKQPFSTNFSKDVVERPLMVTLNQLKHLVGKG